MATLFDLAELIALCAYLQAEGITGDGAVWAATSTALGQRELEEGRSSLRLDNDLRPLELRAPAQATLQSTRRSKPTGDDCGRVARMLAVLQCCRRRRRHRGQEGHHRPGLRRGDRPGRDVPLAAPPAPLDLCAKSSHHPGVRELPTGTVTFLFTDVEGSTRLLHELGGRYADVLAEHRRALRESFARHGGVEVDTQGDAFFVAFAKASDALAAAAEGRDALESSPIRVRVGLHTGEPLLTQEGYVGIDVHRAARIAGAGHGGQILVSQSTRDLAQAGSLRDLGEHRLKDLTAPERIYQLGDDDFPPLKSLNQTNLPVQPTPLVGRRQELTEVLDLLSASRLVTLTGAGGSGKTRLALQAAAERNDAFPDGVWFVSLAAVRDPELLKPTIAQVVRAREDLDEFLNGQKHLLLLLDNLEQLLPDAAPLVASLDAHVLATSRERLNVSGEQEYAVPPMLPEEAVALFTQRARQLRPRFEPDEHVTQIARRLDGLPLALELAAARVKVLTPKQIKERLTHGLELLRGGAHDAPERQRTLRATIEWSYDLLCEEEQLLFARLAVFAGSFDLEAAEAVCKADLDTLASLVDKSLLRQTEDGRFFVLETIREYASARLGESAEATEMRRRHAHHLLKLTEHAEPKLRGAEQMIWLDRLEVERDNIRAALDWAREAEESALELRIACAVRDLWVIRGPDVEARRRLEQAVGHAGTELPERRADALNCAAFLAYRQGDYGEADSLASRALEVAQAIGDRTREGGAIGNLANVALAVNDFERARSLYEELLVLSRQSGDPWRVAVALTNLGDLALAEGDYERAAQFCEEGRDQAHASGDSTNEAIASMNLAVARLQLRDLSQAAVSLRHALRLAVEVGDQIQVILCLFVVGALAQARGEAAVAARLVGFTDFNFTESGYTLEPAERRLHEQLVGSLWAELGETYEDACRDGSKLSLDEALELARALD
jgi:predicted ATPase/class 3 adenylate cyclase